MSDETNAGTDFTQDGAMPAEDPQVAIDAESTTATEDASAGATDNDDQDAERPGNVSRNLQKRIDRLTRSRYEAEARARHLEEQLRNVQQQQEQSPARQTPDQPIRREDFETYEEYIEARAEARAVKRMREEVARQEAAQRQAASQAHAQSVQAQWIERVESARDKFDDFDDVMNGAKDDLPPHILEALIYSEDGADIAYHLAKNPKELDRLAKLHPVAATRELQRFADKVAGAAQQKEVSRAPAPTPIAGSKSKAGFDPMKLSADEWARWRNEQVRTRR
ncbi:MAG: Vibrio phage VvAW1 [Pseudomonadota bacterium]|jgi:hypothetical protein